MQPLILRSFQSPGDIVMLTAALRDLHAAQPGRFQTDVRTSADALFENNPQITNLREGAVGVQVFDMQYPLVHRSNQRPYHFLHGYTQFLEERLGIKIPVTQFCGEIHLSEEEKQSPPPGYEQGLPEHFWIVIAGGKFDFTAKWWNPASYQAVVDHFQGKIQFVQCGESGHWHPPLENVISFIGKTSLRDFVRLMYHADGVLCPVTFAMHLSAAVETKPSGRFAKISGGIRNRMSRYTQFKHNLVQLRPVMHRGHDLFADEVRALEAPKHPFVSDRFSVMVDVIHVARKMRFTVRLRK